MHQRAIPVAALVPLAAGPDTASQDEGIDTVPAALHKGLLPAGGGAAPPQEAPARPRRQEPLRQLVRGGRGCLPGPGATDDPSRHGAPDGRLLSELSAEEVMGCNV